MINAIKIAFIIFINHLKRSTAKTRIKGGGSYNNKNYDDCQERDEYF